MASGDGVSVLVVEDEPILLMLVAETLREAGFTVHEAGEGPVALSHLQSHPDIRLMLSDIKMPGMNGYQVAETALQSRPDLKIVLMTGYSEEALPKAIADAGVQVLHKPFNVDELPAIASRILDRS